MQRFLDFISRTKFRFIAVLLLVIGIFASGLFFYFSDALRYPELAELSSTSLSAEEYADYFTKLAREKGAVYAFTILYKAPFPFGIDTHTIAHYVGYILYEERGSDAITFCTEEYLDDACVHAIVIQGLVREGHQALQYLTNACENLPRGTSAYADCFHGMGHGILSYLNYDYEETVTQCKEVGILASQQGSQQEHQALYVWKQCIDGATMELFQPLHDKQAQAMVKETYLPDSDPLMPCDASFLPDEVRSSCYIYVRSRALRAAGIAHDDFSLNADKHRKALSYCEAIPNVGDRKACYGGFGMHFVYTANGNDNRTFQDMNDEALKKINTLCSLAPTLDWQSPCVLTAAETILIRSRDVDTAMRLCSLTPDATIKDRCYRATIELTTMYVPKRDRLGMCTKVPVSYKEFCYEKTTDS